MHGLAWDLLEPTHGRSRFTLCTTREFSAADLVAQLACVLQDVEVDEADSLLIQLSSRGWRAL